MSFARPPDFDSPSGSSGADGNEYLVTVVVTDDGTYGSEGQLTGPPLERTLEVTVTVTDVNEGPDVSGPGTFTIDENQNLSNAVYTATDPEDPDAEITRWSVSGRDGGDFAINEVGELTFRKPPDFERPADSNRNNEYEVTVRASDGRVNGAFDVTVSVEDVNEAPDFRSGSKTSFTYRENGTSALYTYRATDPEQGELSWSVRDRDAEDFVIGATGVLSFARPPDFDSPSGSSGADGNEYLVTVVVTDDGTYGSEGQLTGPPLERTLEVTVTVTDVNEGPEVAGQQSLTVDENHDQVLSTYSATDPEDPDAAITRWSVSGRDGGDFTITDTSEQTGQNTAELTFRNVPDYDRPADANRDNEYVLTIRAYNGSTYGSLDVTVTVTDQNEAEPEVSGRDSLRVSENFDRTLHTYRARDTDLGTTFVWSVRGADGGDFSISDSGALTFSSTPNYERPADADFDNVYEITIVASDGTKEGRLDVSISVTDVNEGPVIEETSANTAITVVENHDRVLSTYSATDPEDPGAAITRWSVSGRDGGDFTINEGGELAFRNTPDYDRPADSNRDNVYEVTIRAHDSRAYGNLNVTVTVTDVNEPPTITTIGTSATSLRQNENRTSRLYTYRATDPDNDDVIKWSVGGTDRSHFTIDERGQFSFNENNPPDFDKPADSNRDNIYNVTVVASDANRLTDELEVTVTVTDVNEGPVIEETSANTAITVGENHDRVLSTYSATDPEDPDAAITRWSVSGRDGGDFTINEGGELAFRNTPDYDRPADSNRDNVYEVTIRAHDSRAYGNLNVTVTVTDVNEPPTITTIGTSATSLRQNENRTSRLYTYRATDPDNDDVITWSVGGTDRSHFTIDERGQFSFNENNPPDFDKPGDVDGDNVYKVTVVASDANRLTDELEVTVTVTDVNEGPDVSGPGTFTIDENQNLSNAVYRATDPEDPGAAITRWSVSGRDGGDFAINEAGQLTFRKSPDFERPADSNRDNTYELTVRASDGRVNGTFDVTVVVVDVNEAPEFRSGSKTSFTYRENGTSAIYTYRATDPEGSDVTWGISGTDRSAFTMSETGVLSFGSPPDYERPADSGSKNVYELTVEARDENDKTAGLEVTVTVTNVTDVGVPSSLRVARHASGQLRVFWNAPDSGTPPTGYTVQWKKSGADWTDEEDVSEEPVTDTSHIIKGLSDGVEYDVRVIASKDATESAPSKEASATPEETAPPTASSATVDGATLSIAFNEDLDSGEPPDKSAFAVTVEGNSRGVDAVAVSGSVATITLVTAVFAGDAVTVDYTAPPDESAPRLQDLAGNAAASFSKQNVSNNTTAADQMTAAVSAVPEAHDGDFTFELRFSDAPHDGFSHTTMRDHAFTVTGGVVTSARQLDPPGNIGWEIRVTPEGDGTVTIVLPVTTDCTAPGAICTGDRRPLSNRLEITVPGPPGQQASQENSPATGAPTISGTAQVGETLMVETSGISDSDGLTDATFSYQWLADETVIEGATDSTYTLIDSEAGKAIKVRVTVTDDAENQETLTSEPTTAVAAAGVQPKSATVDGFTLILTYEENLDEGVTLPSSGFTVTAGGNDRAVNGVSVSGKTVNLTLAAAVAAGEAVKVGYAKPDGPDFIRDTLGREGDSFSDYAVTNNTPVALPQQQEAVNTPATGAPTISGTAQVGETLTVDTSNIADADGLDNATFSYQWVRVDGQTETDIPNAVAPAYHPTTDDVGKAIKVNVSITDDADHNEGPLGSAVTDVVEDSDMVQVLWTATLTTAAEAVDLAKIGYGAPSSYPKSSLVPATFVVGATTYTIREVAVDAADLLIHITPQLRAADVANWRVLVGATEFTPGTPVNAADVDYSLLKWDENDLDWNAGNRLALALLVVNTAATGQPTISGTAQVGETLRADTSGVADADGLANASFSYEWLADETVIAGATDSTYTLVAADEGRAIKVRVSFTDDEGNDETLTSSVTTAVAAAAPTPNSPATGTPTIGGTAQVGETLRADTSGVADADGLANASFSYEWLADETVIAGATDSTYSLVAADEGKAIRVRVSFTDDASHAEVLTSDATETVTPKPNSAATGQPTISGTAQVGETLTVDTASIADADGLANASFSYEWLADETVIAGATDSTYSLVAADEGKAIKVRVSFTDDEGNDETLTSSVTTAVAAAAPTPNSPATGTPTIGGTAQVGETLRADTSGVADADGLANASFSYEWLADETVIAGATDSTYTLVAADEGKAIRVRVSFTDDASHAEVLTSDATETVTPKPNSAATGQPTISGTAQVGETLTVDTASIADADGLANASFSYEWLADKMVIAGATDSTYTLVAADEGKAVTVQVSFTDDEGNDEILTSAPTAAVAGAQPTEPPAKPTVLSATASHDR